jgi:hypothetical protein
MNFINLLNFLVIKSFDRVWNWIWIRIDLQYMYNAGSGSTLT